MKANMKVAGMILALAAVSGASSAVADSCKYNLNWRPEVTAADRVIMKKACASGWLPHWWAKHGFKNDANYWDDGFGSDNLCNADAPLGRTLNALYLLKFSYTPPNKWGDYKTGFVVQEGYPYAGKQFVEANDMEAHCGNYDPKTGKPTQYASYVSGPFTDHFEWKMGFFYLENPVERSMSLFHESIHRGTGKDHDNVCADGKKDRSWAYQGAYYWGVKWLMSYYLHANTNTNETYRTWAAQNANYRIANKFCAGDVPSSVKNWAGSKVGY